MSSPRSSSQSRAPRSPRDNQGQRGSGAQHQPQGKGGGGVNPKRLSERAPAGTAGALSGAGSPPAKQQQGSRERDSQRAQPMVSVAHSGRPPLAQPNFDGATVDTMRSALEQPPTAYSPGPSPGHYSVESSHHSVRSCMLANEHAHCASVRNTFCYMHVPAFRLARNLIA